jgi:hypothetical protein
VNVAGLNRAIGDDLPGAQGKTLADQTKIDLTVARGCAAGIFEKDKCEAHTPASVARRQELSGALAD